MGEQVKPKVVWISTEDLKPPKGWTLPFEVTHQNKRYKITGLDAVDQVWRAEEINGE